MTIVDCFNFPGDTEANARLIAAAPELLEFVLAHAECCEPDAMILMAKATGDQSWLDHPEVKRL